MKAAAERSSSTASRSHSTSAPFFAKASGAAFAAATRTAPAVQLKLAVSQPGDKLEQEADRMADRVVRDATPPVSARPQPVEQRPEEKLHKKDDERLQRKGVDAAPAVGGDVQSAIRSKTTGGEPMSHDVRNHMEPRFGADFGNVRIHTDPESAGLSNQLSARAFTYQNHIFFSRDQYQPDTSEGRHLLAHELTHAIQQGQAVQRSPQVSTTTTAPLVQRLGVQDALDKFAEWGYNIPGFRLLTIVLGFNPINMRQTDRNAANLLRALIELLPGGAFITQALDNHGVINKAAAWIDKKIAALGDIGADIVAALKRFIDSLSWRDIFSLGSVWERAKRIFTDPITRLIAFGASVAIEILKMVKDAILKPLAALAEGTRGYDLLKALLGEDPITGEPVPRTADNLLGGFMKLIGQEEIWENIKKGNAVARAWTWFQQALEGLMGFARSIPKRFVAMLSSLTFQDIITVAGAFAKVAGTFLSIAGEFFSWAGTTIWNLLEIVFDVVKPGIMGYVKKTGAALKSILKNPLPFVGNLVRAAKLGFTNFADNFGAHLKAGLIDWLMGSLTGVYIPKALTLPELGRFALSILGITWAQIRGKIVKALGPNGEKVMQGLETAFDVVVALVKGGVTAAWELIKEKLTDLKDTVVSGIIGFVIDTLIKKAIPKLIAMFIPGAGFISAIMSIYDTVMVFVQKISKIIQVVVAFIDSIVAIAGGAISAAAKRVESILGGLISLAISFLAGFLGLGKITDKIMGVIEKVRTTVDKAIDAVIGWIVGKAKALFAKLFSKKDKPDNRSEEQKTKDKLAAIAEAESLVSDVGFDESGVRGKLSPIKSRFNLSSLDLVVDTKASDTETFHFTASASDPEVGKPKQVKLGVAGPGTPVPANSWICNLQTKPPANPHEQVTSSATVKVRPKGGVERPLSFTTAVPAGGGNTHSYDDEGRKWQRTTFTHGSKHAVPIGAGKFELIPSSRGREFIRSTFYEDEVGHDTIKNSRLPSLLNPADSNEFLSEGSPSGEAQHGYVRKDPATGRALVPVSHASADHEPSVAQHWSQAGRAAGQPGNNATQAARVAWNINPATYRIMSKKLNSGLGGKGATYTHEVGVGSPGTELEFAL